MANFMRMLSNSSESGITSARIFAISDLHVDYKENMEFVKSWPGLRYKKDALICAGDVTDDIDTLETTLKILKSKFSEVFYVPGNHELWIRPKERVKDSVAKHRQILTMCRRIGVHTSPAKFQINSDESVWIVPLFSWYATPEEDSKDTLHMTHPSFKDDAHVSNKMWMDNHLCVWPNMGSMSKAKYFAKMNDKFLNREYNAPVITFSHMVPRKDLIPPVTEDRTECDKDRASRGLGTMPKYEPPVKGFNFTRYAGCQTIDTQLRKINSVMHIYGHQHRNRDRVVDGVKYISHCLGNPKEQEEGWTYGVTEWKGPKLVWPVLNEDSLESSYSSEDSMDVAR